METGRRDFMLTAAGAAAVAAGSTIVSSCAQAEEPKKVTEMSVHKLPALPYAYDALEPYIDAQTLKLHHDKHHAGYVKGLNAAEKALEEARAKNDFSLVQYWSRKSAFHGAGAYLHDLYWNSMTPDAKKEPGGKLMKKITEDFGSLEAFKNHFSAAAKSVEGSGWALLVQRPEDDQLLVLQAENHQKLSPWNVVPLMCIDVWEHAYYLKYQNKRGDYISNWWNIVNWDFVEKNLMVHK